MTVYRRKCSIKIIYYLSINITIHFDVYFVWPCKLTRGISFYRIIEMNEPPCKLAVESDWLGQTQSSGSSQWTAQLADEDRRANRLHLFNSAV